MTRYVLSLAMQPLFVADWFGPGVVFTRDSNRAADHPGATEAFAKAARGASDLPHVVSQII